MFFFFRKSKSARKRARKNADNEIKPKKKQKKKGGLTYEQMLSISNAIIQKKRLMVYADSVW